MIPMQKTLLGFLREMEFATLTRRIADKLGTEPPQASEVSSVSAAKTPAPAATAPAETAKDGAATPAAGVTFAVAAVTATPFDRKGYATVTTAAGLAEWIAAVYAAGRCAVAIKASSIDAVHADIIGIALATGPGKACYIPVGPSRHLRRLRLRRRRRHRPSWGARSIGLAEAAPRRSLDSEDRPQP